MSSKFGERLVLTVTIADDEGCRAWCSHIFTEEEIHGGKIRDALAYFAPKLLGNIEKAGLVEV